ncbi:MAG TPA: hypothetical protein DCY03_14940, partial [Planctomycetaceae bacterium]|nr:hypothetical protein [Planctomycetaceae bacterium]
WQLTELNAATAVFYRTDNENETTKKFLAEHQLDFKKQAFREQKDFPEIRTDWARPRSFYSRYLLPQNMSMG